MISGSVTEMNKLAILGRGKNLQPMKWRESFSHYRVVNLGEDLQTAFFNSMQRRSEYITPCHSCSTSWQWSGSEGKL